MAQKESKMIEIVRMLKEELAWVIGHEVGQHDEAKQSNILATIRAASKV